MGVLLCALWWAFGCVCVCVCVSLGERGCSSKSYKFVLERFGFICLLGFYFWGSLGVGEFEGVVDLVFARPYCVVIYSSCVLFLDFFQQI